MQEEGGGERRRSDCGRSWNVWKWREVCTRMCLDHSPCRLAGYENTLLGYKTRLYKLLKEHLDAIDVIMFGEITLPLS